MSGAIGSSNYGTLERMLGSLGTLRDQYSTLQQQTTTGLVAQTYAGLGAQSSQVLDLSAASSQTDAYTQSITTAQGKASVMQTTLSQIQSVVSTLSAQALTVTASASPSSVTSMAAQAKLAFSQVVSLLNTQYGGDYVFSGADTSNPPVPSPETATTSGMYAQIGAQVAALATTPTSPAVGTVIANTVATAASTAAGTTIFSAYLTGAGATAAPSAIQIGDGQQVTLDVSANRNTGAVSDPAINGTGSAINDILGSLAVMANSTGAMASNPDFSTLMQNASKTLTSAGSTLTEETGQIGLTQDTLTAAASSQASLKTALSTQLSGLTNVDMASAISQLQAVGNQLQASYNVLAEARSLSLSNYL